MAQPVGGEHTTSTVATQLSSNSTPLQQLIVRAGTFANSATIGYIGGSDVTSSANRHGYVKTGESYNYGPLSQGYVRASDIYYVGTSSADTVFWEGIPQ